MKQNVNKIINSRIYFIAISVLAVIIMMNCILNLGYVTESLYQTIKDGFFWRAMIYFMIFVLLMNKTKFFNWQTGVYAVIAAFFVILLSYKHRVNPEYYLVVRNRNITYALCGGLLLDLCWYKKIVIKDRRTIWFSILYVVCMLPAFLLKKGVYSTIVPIIPMIIFLLVKTDKNQWLKVSYWFSGGYYCAFLYTMLKSFVSVPYTGERYYGIFINNGLFGMFAGGAFICALYWLVMELKREKKRIVCLVAEIISIVFALVCVDIISAKVAIFGVLLTIPFAFIFLTGNKKSRKLRLFIFAGSFLVVLILGVLVVLFFKNLTQDDITASISNGIIREKVLYLHSVIVKSLRTKSKYGLIKAGTLLNNLDWFTSGRISWWIVYLRNMNLWGHPSLSIDGPFKFMEHPHNTYVAWLYQFGIIPGGLYILSFISGLVLSFIGVLKEKKTYIFSFLWLLYSFGVFWAEVEIWTFQIGFIVLFVMYPLALDLEKRSKK